MMIQASLDERDAELREAKAEEVRLVGELEVSRAEYVSASRQLASVSEAASATSGAEENLCGVTAGLQEKLAASETALERQRVVDKELTAALEQSRKEEAVVRDEAARADTAVMELKEQVQAGHERADGLEESLHKAEQALRDTTDTLEVRLQAPLCLPQGRQFHS
jgi:chromosome segregation ATPase